VVPPEQMTRQKAAERMDGTSTCAPLGPSALHVQKSTAERPPVLLTLDHYPLCQPPLEASQFSRYPPVDIAAEEV
ncbi:Alpha/beta hydrolase, partial [Giardia duodenalis]